MKNLLIALLLSIAPCCDMMANDGVFYVNGNEIIPITDTDIRVDREILDINKISDTQVAVSVYYEFFNPGDAKTLSVGFEADCPSGDVEEALNGNVKNDAADKPHPNIHNFTVMMNECILPFTNKMTFDKVLGYANKYVYLFRGNFKSGKNIIRHTYICDLSMSVDAFYSFSYVLDAARRWAGGTIGDFTLNINMGQMTAFRIPETFFKSAYEWTVVGTGKALNAEYKWDEAIKGVMKCYIRQGCMSFHKTDFHPDGNLQIMCLDGICTWGDMDDGGIDVRKVVGDEFSHIPFSEYKKNPKGKDEFSQRVIRNLKYAQRGYVFKSKDLSDFFNGIEWYMPDPNYKP